MNLSSLAMLVSGSALVGLFIYATLGRPWNGWRVQTSIWAASAIIALFTVVVLASGKPHLGDIRISLLGVVAPVEDMRFGGSRTEDAIIIGARSGGDAIVHSGALTAARRPDGTVDLTFQSPPVLGPAGLVEWRLQPKPWRSTKWTRLGSVPLNRGHVICIPRARGGFTTVSIDDVGRVQVAGRTLGQIVPVQSSSRAMSLLRHVGSGSAADIRNGPLAAARTLISRQSSGWPFTRPGVVVDLLDPGAFIGQGNCSVPAAEAQRRVTLQLGNPVELSFLSLRESEDWLAIDRMEEDEVLPAATLIVRRSMTVELVNLAGEQRLSVTFATPETEVLDAANLKASLPPGPESRVRVVFRDRSEGDGGSDIVLLPPRALGAPVLQSLSQRLEFDEQAWFRVAGDAPQPIVRAFGREVVPIGAHRDGAHGAAATVRVERIDWSWAPFAGLFMLVLTGLACSLAATFRWRAFSPYAFIIFTLADFLLCMRLLVAIEGAAIDPSAVMAKHVAAALLALFVIPFATLAITPKNLRPSRATCLLHAAVVLLVAVHVQFVNGGVEPSAGIAFGGILAAAAVWARWSTAITRTISEGWCATRRSLADVARRRPGFITKQDQGAVWKFFPPWLPNALLLTTALCLLRLIIPARAPLIPINTAALYTPLVVLMWAYVFHHAQTSAAKKPLKSAVFCWFWAALCAGATVGAAFLQDRGYIIVQAFVLAVITALLAGWRPIGASRRLIRGFLAAPLLLFTILLLSLGSLSLFGSSEEWPAPRESSSEAIEVRDRMLDRATRIDTNGLRFRGLADEARLEDIGTQEAEGLRAAMHAWREYSAQGIWGRGYLNLPEPTELRRYHLSDNLAAVHLLAPFGRLGTAAFILVLLFGAAAPTLALNRAVRGAWPSMSEFIGVFSLWSLAAAGIYMILANLDVVPFTGRNVVLLSAYSPSDLVEGCALLALAASTLGRRSA